MNWVRNNRFLAGFIAVMVVGVGVLGYLLFSAQSRASDVDDKYKAGVTELNRLQTLQPYPDLTNQKKYEELRTTYAQSTRDLQAKLASYDLPPTEPPPTPLQFQDRLRGVVADTVQAAQQAGVELPKDRFYLGFEQYSGTPPDATATPYLDSELTAVNDIVGILLHPRRIESLASIKRGPLPGEPGSVSPTSTPANRPGSPGPKDVTNKPLVIRYPVQFAFTALPSSFREIINALTTSNRLYVIRALQVKNQMDKGPARVSDAPTPTPAVDPNDPNAAPLPDKGPPPLRYVVGQEKLDVVLVVELTKVLPPTTVAAR